MSRIWKRLLELALRSRARRERDLDLEIRNHLALEAEESGRPTPFGNVARVKEDVREAWGWARLEQFGRDVHYGFRQLKRNPGFSAIAIATLALGIGATTAVFSMVNTVLLKPLPIADADRVVLLITLMHDQSGRSDLHPGTSQAKFRHWRDQSAFLENISVFAVGREPVNYTGGDVAEQWNAIGLSREAFRCLDIRIVRGRTFTAEEDSPKGPPAMIVSEAVWKTRFAGDPAILGKTVALNGAPRTVVGIAAEAPAILEFGNNPQIYLPAQFDPNSRDFGSAGGIYSVARLKPGITLEQAKIRLQASAAEYRKVFPDNLDPDDTLTAVPIREFLVRDARRLLLLLLGAVGLVLLIACANVANLFAVRSRGRSREIAVRTAIGAGQGRIIRQLLTESLLLSLAGGALGLALGYSGIRALLALSIAQLPRVGEHGVAVTLDGRVAAFTLAVSIVTGLVFGLSPALQAARADLNAILKSSSRTNTGFRQNRSHAFLVVSEVGLAVVLLVGSALLIRSFAALYTVDRGFDISNVVTMRSLMASPRYSKSAVVNQAISSGLERVRSLPGVVAVSATCCVPLEDRVTLPFDVVGRPSADPGTAGWRSGSPGYFDVLKIPLKRGRALTSADDAKSVPVALINQRMAREFWKDRDPLNDRIVIGKGLMKAFDDEPARQIVGIVGDTRQELNSDPVPTIYVPQSQLPEAMIPMFSHAPVWLVRTQPGSQATIPAIQEQLRQATGVPAANARSMDEIVKLSTGRERFSMLMMTIFGGVAVLLAAIGVYGLMAYTVAQRTHEIGIRLALGAEAAKVRKMVVRQGAALALTGVGLGLAAAWALAHTLESLLFEVKPRDPFVFAAVPVLLTAVALFAIWIPALRASKVDPLDALRHE